MESMAHFGKHFTLGEANALIPWVRSVFLKIHRILHEVITERERGQAEPATWHASGNGHGNGNGGGHAAAGTAEVVEISHVWSEMTSQQKGELINGLLGALQEEGIVIQDVHRGLIDFPGWRGDEEVLLCYELSDGNAIGYWHDLTAGYAGRLPIDEAIRR
jgi:hypothetical protein